VGPTSVGPTSVGPTSVGPTSVGPTSVEPTSVEPTSVEPTSVEPTSVGPTVVPAQCADEEDNDGDGFVDLDDPGCDGPQDNDERPIDPCPKGYFWQKDASSSTSGSCIKEVE
jgi:hypothetical protein